MALTKEDRQEIIELIEQAKQNIDPKVSPEWKQLRKEIDVYCHEQVKHGRGYVTVQEAIYRPIKFVTGVKRIDMLTGPQVDQAQKIFEFIKQEKGVNGNERD